MIIKESYHRELVLPETVEYVRKRRLGRSVPRNPALLILDMQEFFLSDQSHAWVPEASCIISGINNLKDIFLDKGFPVIFTKHVNSIENAANMGIWWRDILKAKDPLSRLTPAFDTKGSDLIEKGQYDAFYNTDLEDILKQKNVDSLIISGVMTHLCCETTARSAFVKGFDVYFGIDLTATYNREFHNSTLLNISHGFGLPVFNREITGLLEKLD